MPDHSKKIIYLGPSKPFNLPFMQNSILADEPEKVFPALAPFFEKYRNFKKLFVPVTELAGARASLKLPGSRLSIISDEIGTASADFKKQMA